MLHGLVNFGVLVEGCISYLWTILSLRALLGFAFKHSVTVATLLALVVGVLVGFILGK